MSTNDNQPSIGVADNNITSNETPLPLDTSHPAPATDTGIVHILAPNADSEKLNVLLQYGEESHLYVREFIRAADQKATFFFATFAALLA